MALPSPTTFSFSHESQPDALYTAMTSTQVKAGFDSRASDVATTVSGILAALESTTLNDDGSNCIGFSNAQLPSQNTVQGALNYILAQGSGGIPPATSVTNSILYTDVKVGSLAAVAAVDTRLTANASVGSLLVQLASWLPTGLICMWSGALAAVPTGWYLCNGTNGTPDLTNRFIMGSTASGSAPGTVGGANSYTLSTTQLPAFTLSGSTDAGGAHVHNESLSLNSSGSGAARVTNASQNVDVYQTGAAIPPTHTHTFSAASPGTGATIENRPLFYALAYIMKA